MVDTRVRVRGTDSSGRPIYASDYMWEWWEALVDLLGFRPTITQGAWMSKVPGGGADASAGYHDYGGCFDLRTWDLTLEQVAKVIRLARKYGAAIWLRNAQHGGFSDPHLHLVLGSDAHLSLGAEAQWLDYTEEGGDGMGGRDYHPRPSPIVTVPPEEMFMPTADEIAKAVWDREIAVLGTGDKLRAAVMLAQAHNRTGDTRTLARALRAAGIPVDESTIEKALRKVLGSLDAEV